MRRTKNMVYKPTEESYELYLYAVNDGRLYRQFIAPAIKCLKKKYQQGIYDKEKAIDLYYTAATEASNHYFKEFDYKFSVTDRYTAAVDMEAYYMDEVTFEEVE